MRLRNIPKAEELVSASPFFVHNPRRQRGQWFRFLGNEHQIHIEIGSGKGQFLLELAKDNPDINYIGIEHYTSVLLRAIQKAEADPVPNLHFLCVDASVLPEIFEKGEIDRIYLNFPDPWPKDRHIKRRLTSSDYLLRYAYILAEDGSIELKTDNQKMYKFTLEEIRNSKIWKLDASTDNLHKDGSMNEGNIMTEYEEKFSGLGHVIYKLIASYKDNAWNELPPLPDISRQPNLWEIDHEELEISSENGENPAQDSDSSSQNDVSSSSQNNDPGDPREDASHSQNTRSEISDTRNCLKITAWCEGQAWDNIYNFVIRLEHNGDHQSYGQSITLELSEPVGIVEVPGDVYADVFDRYVHVHRNNQLTGNGLTEIWIRLSCGSWPKLKHIYDITCR